MPRTAQAFVLTAFALAVAAVWALAGLWPDTSSLYDTGGVEVAAAQAQAVTAGGTLLVGACVCAVGAVVAGRHAGE